ncbi:MAG: AAA family ATPase [Hyphomonadaceae bacterium]|nr:AAA family ATPase [Hyphomonadaceae bacterium]
MDAHEAFYAKGVEIVESDSSTTCPFCEQSITSSDPKAIIDAYVEYFKAEEQKHKTELRNHYKSYRIIDRLIDQVSASSDRQKIRFDKLKEFVPSQKLIELEVIDGLLAEIRSQSTTAKSIIEQKAESLSSAVAFESDPFQENITKLNAFVAANNAKCEQLRNAVDKADDERRSLHRTACSEFEAEFAYDNWEAIEQVRELADTAKQRQSDANAVEQANPNKDARERVAETFELLLKSFFGEKYTFQKDDFTLKRGEQQMLRGPHRTLSDGEKTAIAFCYFIASTHRKVRSNSDYLKLFLVFDDPVTSMSYDFIYSIAQTLKYLSISDKGSISINPSQIGKNGSFRPNLLILTHSSYFFNLSRTNRVVKDDASFSMFGDSGTHKIARLKDYISPFERQLHHVWEVSRGKEADHSTGNAVRSVLEALGRFCRPDKSHSLENFVSFLAGEEDISIKSVMINSLCHGTYYAETPPPDDLKLACEEAVSVVEKFAPGQLEVIRAS